MHRDLWREMSSIIHFRRVIMRKKIGKLDFFPWISALRIGFAVRQRFFAVKAAIISLLGLKNYLYISSAKELLRWLMTIKNRTRRHLKWQKLSAATTRWSRVFAALAITSKIAPLRFKFSSLNNWPLRINIVLPRGASLIDKPTWKKERSFAIIIIIVKHRSFWTINYVPHPSPPPIFFQ